jgi:hypothetical protein
VIAHRKTHYETHSLLFCAINETYCQTVLPGEKQYHKIYSNEGDDFQTVCT